MKLHPLTVPAGVVSFGMVAAAGLMSLRVTAGPLNPPAGAVGSTYKTLTEVEPRIAINSTNTPGDADSVFKITQPGSYYLTGNVTGVIGKHGIEIGADDVTVDLSGFRVRGVVGALHGVTTDGNRERVTIRNGTIAVWNGKGVSFTSAAEGGCVVEGVTVSTCGSWGISCGFNSRIENCLVASCVSGGITAGANSSVIGCVQRLASGAFATGITVSQGSVVERCGASSNAGGGFSLGDGAVARGCTSSNNVGDGYYLFAGASISGCTARLNGNTGVQAAWEGAAIVDCTVVGNANVGIYTGSNVRVSGCTVVGGLGGIQADDGCTVVGCAVRDTTGIGIRANNGCHIENNLTRNNQQDGIYVNFSCAVIGNNCNGDGAAAGNHGAIRVIGQANRVEGNNISYADRGLYLTSGGNAVFKNSLKGCTVNFDVVGGNDVGPIGSAATATSPWANIQY